MDGQIDRAFVLVDVVGAVACCCLCFQLRRLEIGCFLGGEGW